jgi:formylmethanofuran dehydrogenase subunit E
MTDKREIMSLVKEAAKLHGHLGPFLVIGVRMGNLTQETLDLDENEKKKLQATVYTPLFTPFSCILDGVQTTTSCTIGNQRLKIRNSRKRLTGLFQTHGASKTLRISVKPEVIKRLTEKTSQHETNEQLAAEIASMPADQLFEVEQH